jgi:hypothetical protein
MGTNRESSTRGGTGRIFALANLPSDQSLTNCGNMLRIRGLSAPRSPFFILHLLGRKMAIS